MRIWLDSVGEPLPLAAEDGLALVRWTATALQARQTLPPGPLISDRAPRLVFLSVSDGERPACVVMGRGLGLLAAVKQALRLAHGLPGLPQPRWVKLDLVQAAAPFAAGAAPGVRGIAFAAESELAFLPEEVAASRLLDEQGRLQPDRADDCLRRRTGEPWAPAGLPQTPVYSFVTEGFFCDGKEAVPVVGGSRPVSAASPADLMQAAIWAGEYTLHALDEQGQFCYLYDPVLDRAEAGYNLLRHAGAAYVLSELAQASGQDRFLEAAGQAIGYLVKHLVPCRVAGQPGLAFTDDQTLNLGGIALAALALLHYEQAGGGDRYRDLLQRLAETMLCLQRDDGSFVQKANLEGKAREGNSAFYPGEAMLALLRLHALHPDLRWVEAVARGVDFMVRAQEQLPPTELLGNHWLLYCLEGISRLRPQPRYLEHAMRLARAMIATQHRDPGHPERVGGFGNCYTTTAAARAEGLAAAYRLARDFRLREEAVAILVALRLGIDFQLGRQYRPEAAMYYRRPRRTLGGFLESPRSPAIRIDGPQHNIASFLAMRQLWLPQATG